MANLPNHLVFVVVFCALVDFVKLLIELLGRAEDRRFQSDASQVTAVVQKVTEASAATIMYDVAIRAWLVHPYFVRLIKAVQLPKIQVATVTHKGW